MVRLLVGLTIQSALFAILIFGPGWAFSGTLVWPRGMLALAVLVAVSGVGGLWFLKTDPALTRERASAPNPQTMRDALATGAIAISGIVWFVLVAWDVHRLHLPSFPAALSIAAGLTVFSVGVGVIIWTFRVNTFAVSVVKVQDDRAQRVIDSGPYSLVRHPMYLGAVAFFAGLGFILGSTVAALLAVPLFIVAFTPRILVEEAVLRQELIGYAAYQSRVRTRIVPGLF